MSPVLTHFVPLQQWHFQSPVFTIVSGTSFRPRSRRRRRHSKHNKLTTSSPTQPKLETVIDLNQITAQASSTFRTLIPSSFDLYIHQFVASGKEAYADLRSLVTFNDKNRVLISCRPSTLHFVGTSAILSIVAVFVCRVLVNLVSGIWPWCRNSSGYRPLVRRDRSLGGKEVIVGWGNNDKERGSAKYNYSSSGDSLFGASAMGVSVKARKNRVQIARKLPKWWPTSIKRAILTGNEQEYKREAYRVVGAIKNTRMRGGDIMENDIIHLRKICRLSGVQVTIDPTNIRDSLYRASVDFVLNECCRVPTYSTLIEFNGEDIREFLAGFAENIRLENVCAATILSAAVAARTRSCLLQAWALEMQGKSDDAKVELSKICLFLRIFPPEESSPEMEMVARSLEKHLKLEQRKHLMDAFAEVCSEESQGAAKLALGLMHPENSCCNQLEDNHVNN